MLPYASSSGLCTEVDDQAIRVEYSGHPFSPGHVCRLALTHGSRIESTAVGLIYIVDIEPQRCSHVTATSHIFLSDPENHLADSKRNEYIRPVLARETIGALGVERDAVEIHKAFKISSGQNREPAPHCHLGTISAPLSGGCSRVSPAVPVPCRVGITTSRPSGSTSRNKYGDGLVRVKEAY